MKATEIDNSLVKNTHCQRQLGFIVTIKVDLLTDIPKVVGRVAEHTPVTGTTTGGYNQIC